MRVFYFNNIARIFLKMYTGPAIKLRFFMCKIFPRLVVSSWRPWSSVRGSLASTIRTPSNNMWALEKQKNICFVVGRVSPNHLVHVFRPSWVCMRLLEGRVFWPRNVSSELVYWPLRSTERTIHTSQHWMWVTPWYTLKNTSGCWIMPVNIVLIEMTLCCILLARIWVTHGYIWFVDLKHQMLNLNYDH